MGNLIKSSIHHTAGKRGAERLLSRTCTDSPRMADDDQKKARERMRRYREEALFACSAKRRDS